jgi:hypothetical protein
MPDTLQVRLGLLARLRVRDGTDVIAGACCPLPLAARRFLGLFAMFPTPPPQAHSLCDTGSGNEGSIEADEC